MENHWTLWIESLIFLQLYGIFSIIIKKFKENTCSKILTTFAAVQGSDFNFLIFVPWTDIKQFVFVIDIVNQCIQLIWPLKHKNNIPFYSIITQKIYLFFLIISHSNPTLNTCEKCIDSGRYQKLSQRRNYWRNCSTTMCCV